MSKWPKLALVGVPLCIVLIDAAVLVAEHLQPPTTKAIRLVKESKSRKENFTVQQYLYTTVYYSKRRGTAIDIEGWRAAPLPGSATMSVEFTFSDSSGRKTALWHVDTKSGEVTPKDDLADDLLWH
jgi:hypothetical protein